MKKPTKAEQKHMDAVRELGCICCRLDLGVFSPAAIHHVLDTGRRKGHFYVLPLCGLHHQGGNDNEMYTSRHPFLDRFERRYGTEESLLKKVAELLK